MIKKNKQGFTLIELLLVLAVVAALSVAAFVGYFMVSSKYKTNKLSSEISSLSTQTENILNTHAFNNNSFYSGTDEEINSFVFDELSSSMNLVKNKKNTFQSPFGGDILFQLTNNATTKDVDGWTFLISPGSIDSGDCVSFHMSIKNLPYLSSVNFGDNGFSDFENTSQKEKDAMIINGCKNISGSSEGINIAFDLKVPVSSGENGGDGGNTGPVDPGGEGGGQPVDPTDPDDPGGIVDPGDNGNTDPVNPGGGGNENPPVDPVDPTDPGGVVDPGGNGGGQPIDPVNPEDPGGIVDPGDNGNTDPVNPGGGGGQPIDPVNPEDPGGILDPGDNNGGPINWP